MGFLGALVGGAIGALVVLLMRKEPYKEFFYRAKFNAYSEVIKEICSVASCCLSMGTTSPADRKMQKEKFAFAMLMSKNALWLSVQVRDLTTKFTESIEAYLKNDNPSEAKKIEDSIADAMGEIVVKMREELHVEDIGKEIDCLFPVGRCWLRRKSKTPEQV